MQNGRISEIKRGRGRKLTGGSSAPHDLRTVSGGSKNDGNVVPHVPVVVTAVGAVPASPAVEFRAVGADAGWDRQSSTTRPPLALPL
jgi:hypothetical protein